MKNVNSSMQNDSYTGVEHRTAQNSDYSGVERRAFLRAGLGVMAGAATSLMLPAPVKAMVSYERDRSLELYNIHTREHLKTTYWAEGEYISDGLESINHILRDRRNGEIAQMDTGLLELLHDLHSVMGRNKAFEVISGYRSPKSNSSMSKNSSNVAKRSLHMRGMAIDIRMPGTNLASLRKAALLMKKGGVGYYPKDGFIHVDTGRVRFW